MECAIQPALLKMPEQPARRLRPGVAGATLKLKPIDRSQGLLRTVIVDELVGPDHAVRAIWDLTGQWNLQEFAKTLRTQEGQAGRAAWNPRLLLSVWLYAYSEQVTSARQIERLMEYEPGLMWLSGLGEVNHHTLSDFRAEHGEALKKVLAEFLGLLSQQGLINLELVAHDGTRIRARAGSGSFRREATLEKEIAKARQVIEELDKAEEQEPEQENRRREARRRVVAQERQQRMKQAAAELKKIQAGKPNEQERREARVSLTEPEARLMKHGDQGIAPSYNAQLSTDAANKIIVGVHMTQDSTDSNSLLPAMEEIKVGLGRYPRQLVADGGCTNQAAIVGLPEKAIEFYGSLQDPEVRQRAALKAAGIDLNFGSSAFAILGDKQALSCPAGQRLGFTNALKKRGHLYHQFSAPAGVCSTCEFQKKCCPKHPEQGRTISIQMSEQPDLAAFRAKMKGEAARALYRRRGEVAEFPNCWIKEKIGLRKFRLRGLVKATTELFWAVLTYDVMQWMRLSWRPKLAAAGV